MSGMKIAIASEHAGFPQKGEIYKCLAELGHEVFDLGADSPESVDYPYIAANAAERVVAGEYDLGILVCGTGTGMCIAAGKVPGARPALCTNEFMADMARRHNNANILCVGSWVTGGEMGMRIIKVFIQGVFEGGRHTKRVDLIAELERKYKTSQTFF